MRHGVALRAATIALLATACAKNAPHGASANTELVLVARSVNIYVKAPEPGKEAEMIELHIRGDHAFMVQRTQRLSNGRWHDERTETTPGTARPSLDGWLLDFPHREEFTLDGNAAATRLRFSCVPEYRPVHPAGAQPIDLCTPRSRWTTGEKDIHGWWCSVEPKTFWLTDSRFFAPPPGVEDIYTPCCPPVGDACDGWDGGLRMIR